MSNQFTKLLFKYAKEDRIFISDDILNRFEQYYAELLQWNTRINLTTITSPEDAAIKHFLDSLLICKYLPLSGTLIDIGTGAGFPGLPLKIFIPELRIVLVESIRKKASFLKQIIRLLKLEGIEVYNGRIEDFDRQGAFDYAVSRAFSELGLFCRLAAPFLKPSGLAIAMKGKEILGQHASHEIRPPGFTCTALHTYKLPGNRGERSLVLLRKCFT